MRKPEVSRQDGPALTPPNERIRLAGRPLGREATGIHHMRSGLPSRRPSRLRETTSMTQLQKVLIVMLVVLVGIWGCAQGPGGSASAEKIKSLEAKVGRLDEDFRAAAATRDQYRQKWIKAKQATAQLTK